MEIRMRDAQDLFRDPIRFSVAAIFHERTRTMSFSRLAALGIALLAGLARADGTNCFADLIRITALVNSANRVRVGVVEIATSNSYFVAAGQRAGSIDVVAIDYDKELVTLRRGDTTCILALAADPNAPKTMLAEVRTPDSPLYRGEAIEKFLKEHPEAVEQGQIKFPPIDAVPITSGHGETIDRLLSQNPEAARIANTPVTGRGEGIEKFLREHPDVKIDDTPIPEGSLGPGIEAAMKNNPVILSNGIPNRPLLDAPPSLPRAPSVP
jgi:hypothetical protein